METERLEGRHRNFMEDKSQIMFNPRTDHPGYEKDLLPTFERNVDEFRKMPGLHDLADVKGSKSNMKKKTKHSINPFIIPFCDDELVEKETNLYMEEQQADDLGVVEDSGNFTNPFLDPPSDEILSGKETETYIEEHGSSFRKVPGLDDLSDSEDSVNVAENKSAISTNPFLDPSCEDSLSQKEIELYTDKTVTECELPELIVCFKEGSYSIIKDICIDEGLPSIDKIFIENGSNELGKDIGHIAEPKMGCQFETDGANQCVSELDDGNINTKDESMVSDDLKIQTRFSVEDSNPYESCSIHGGEVHHDYDKVLPSVAKDESLTMASKEKDRVENELSVQEFNNINSSRESCDIDGNVSQRQSNEDMSEDGESANSLSSSTAEEEDASNNCNQVSEGETAGTVTLDSDSLPPPTTSGREEDPNTQKSESQRAVHTVNILGLEEDSQTASSRSFFIQHGHGESSFSSAGPFSGPLAYTDPVPYSGSISHRSDSSTTSTRSFAFPVLHSEWNSSPVKMVKPDRRHLRKHRGWKLCFPCCRY
ncbi:hypothetical protein MKW94_026008 [Papaver nudicaule]|uniref:Uncharacterized protein n=1 Tax=Papaver nudicaule TaxID=74823 RepID=A0AA41VMF9_PAPNU|nr:hypothetical protein [Papaver nudicaule]